MERVPQPRARSRAASRGVFSHALLFLTLLAFAFQGFVTQTHIHHPSSATERAAIVKVVGLAATHGGSRHDDGTADCPFCQALVIAGAFFTPTAPSIGPLVGWAETQVHRPTIGGLTVATASFSWRSRAPPQP